MSHAICPNCKSTLSIKEQRYFCTDTDTAECPVCNHTLQSWRNSTTGYSFELVSKTHTLKTWKPFYNDIVTGIKNFEIRKNDRNFQVGDSLILIEVDPDKELEPTGKQSKVKIIYMLAGKQWGLQTDYVVLGIEKYQ